MASDNRLAKRKQMIQNYEIIKQFGEPLSRISAYIKKGIKVMILLRGCSGSGKTTYANQLLSKYGANDHQSHIFSTDNFFINKEGRYTFNYETLTNAHEWNQKLVRLAASEGRSPIFVDNTNTRLWEMKEYACMAVEFGYVVETLEPPTPWFFNEDMLMRKTLHNVPRDTIKKMLDRYEANISGDDILRSLQLNYGSQAPPQGVMSGLDVPTSKKHLKIYNEKFNIELLNQTLNKSAVKQTFAKPSDTLNQFQRMMKSSEIFLTTVNEGKVQRNHEKLSDINTPDGSMKTGPLLTCFSNNFKDDNISEINNISDKRIHFDSEPIPISNEDKNKEVPMRPNRIHPTTSLGDCIDTTEIVTPIPKEQILKFPKDNKKIFSAAIPINTNEIDVKVLRGKNNVEIDNTEILIGRSCFEREHSKIPKQPILAPGVVTADIERSQIVVRDSGIDKLSLMFPAVSREKLEELFDKCQKDIDWTAGLLLDSGQEMSDSYTSMEPIECYNYDNSTSTTFGSCDVIDTEIQRAKTHIERKPNIQINTPTEVLSTVPLGNDNLEEEIINTDGTIDSWDSEEDAVFMLDSDFIFQLQTRFGGSFRPNMIGEKNVISIPYMLARQLHSCIMDSVLQQNEGNNIFTSDAATNKDEEFARHLQDEELKAHGVSSLLEFMDEEAQWKSQLQEEAKNTLFREEAIKQAYEHRDAASNFYEIYKDFLKKSQKANREGDTSGALYYSNKAQHFLEKIEESYTLAAKAILSDCQDLTTLDLHFLKVSEALYVVDLFVDEVIRGLQYSKNENAVLYIITGRGLHSVGGHPRLKPAVKSRLTQRDLQYAQQNPGMLKVIIPRTALTSYYREIAEDV